MKRVLIFSILYILTLLALIVGAFNTMPSTPIDFHTSNILAEGFIALLLTCCVIATQFLYEEKKLYLIMLVGFFLLNIAFISDTLDEVLDIPRACTAFCEDGAMVMGFILIFSGVSYWVRRNNNMAGSLQVLATTDQLTGSFNRYKMVEIINQLLSMSIRYDHDFSILMIDLDHFKKINDEHGHVIGDDVLVRFSELVQSQIRDSDYLVRYGGEEFIVVLPATTIQGAMLVGERIRHTISIYRDGTTPPFTVSVGVTTHREGDTFDSIVKRTDEALYFAKKNGRNRVVQM